MTEVRNRSRAAFSLVQLLCLLAAFGAAGSLPSAAQGQMVSGSAMKGFADVFGLDPEKKKFTWTADLTECSSPGNIVWPDEQPTFTFVIRNTGADALAVKGKVDIIAYGTKGQPGDIWVPEVVKMGDVDSQPIEVNVEKGAAPGVFKIKPTIPGKFGAYALVVDLGPQGRQFLTTCVRTFAASARRIQYPHFCLDVMNLDVMKRLGVQAVRYGLGYVPTTDKGFDAFMEKETAHLNELKAANIAVLLMVGGGPAPQPLGRARPHLDANGVMLDTKSDMAWLPSSDDDFQKWCTLFAGQLGWPKGPINAFSLWNEPWEGISISGWGADMLRYREIYTAMAKGVEQAREADKVQVLIGGCDSTSNAMDKLFCDGNDQFLKWFDYNSIHYQGLNSYATIKKWADRKGPYGRVRIWDTESWVANTDDRVAAVVASNRAAGYDRAMGVFGGNISSMKKVSVPGEDGKNKTVEVPEAWSVAAAVGAAIHFIGEREFKEMLFKNGLPWVMSFDGMPDSEGEGAKPNPEDGTIVVVGDLGEVFSPDVLLFRTARGQKEMAHKAELKKQLTTMPADEPVAEPAAAAKAGGKKAAAAAQESPRAALEAEIAKPEILSDAAIVIDNAAGRFSLFDFYGNPVPPKGGKIVVPLDGRGFFLRGDGKSGSFAALTQAVKEARIEGIEPLAIVAHDMLAPIASHPAVRLSLTNVLNRPVTGKLQVKLGSLTLQGAAADVTIAGNETKDVELPVASGSPAVNNTYHLNVNFDAGADGQAQLEEDLHVNVIAKRTITVDGNLDDWKDVLPQTIIASGKGGPTLMEAAWLPFQKYDTSMKTGFATGYLAYDDKNFYFAAKIADDSNDEGMYRYETRDANDSFYPETSYFIDSSKTFQKKDFSIQPGVEKYGLISPDGDGKARVMTGWIPTVRTYALDFKLPTDRLTQVSLYFLDGQKDERGNCNVQVPGGRGRTQIKECGQGKYLVLALTGEVRITIESWMFHAPLEGIFFDPMPADSNVPLKQDKKTGQYKAGGAVVKVDEDTHGDWKKVYGKDGHSIVGCKANLPSYATLDVPDQLVQDVLHWPEGVRRYSYRLKMELPSGNSPNHDNVQIAFNVVPEDQKPWYSCPPGTMPHFTNYFDTDYEYALNPVAEKYGGGTEIWRLAVPGMPHKHFYPRQPASPFDGPVKDGKLVMKRDETTRFVETAIPWTELPDVKKCLDAGKTIKFSFRVNDNKGSGCMELSKGRSVAKRNGSFHADWVEHWANEVEFSFEK